jgi:hypothetical protein
MAIVKRLNKNNITFEKAAELYTNKTANRILFSYAKDSEISKRDRDYITQAVEQATASVNLAYAKEVVDLNTKNKHAKH